MNDLEPGSVLSYLINPSLPDRPLSQWLVFQIYVRSALLSVYQPPTDTRSTRKQKRRQKYEMITSLGGPVSILNTYAVDFHLTGLSIRACDKIYDMIDNSQATSKDVL